MLSGKQGGGNCTMYDLPQDLRFLQIRSQLLYQLERIQR